MNCGLDLLGMSLSAFDTKATFGCSKVRADITIDQSKGTNHTRLPSIAANSKRRQNDPRKPAHAPNIRWRSDRNSSTVRNTLKRFILRAARSPQLSPRSLASTVSTRVRLNMSKIA